MMGCMGMEGEGRYLLRIHSVTTIVVSVSPPLPFLRSILSLMALVYEGARALDEIYCLPCHHNHTFNFLSTSSTVIFKKAKLEDIFLIDKISL